MKPRRQNSPQPLPQPPKKKWFGKLVTTVQPSQSMGVMYFKLVFNKEHAALERGSWAINDIGPARGITSRGRGTITAIELLKDVFESYE